MSSFLDEVQMFHLKLRGKKFKIDDEFNIVKPLLDTYNNILTNAQQTAHKHAFWCSDYFMTMPVARCVISQMVFDKLSQYHKIPITWFYLIPHQIVIDAAYQHVNFPDEDIEFLDFEGYAKPVTKAAFYDAKKQGIIDKEEEFLFQDDPDVEMFSKHVNSSLESLADMLGVNVNDLISHMTNEKTDFTFPHESDENDDSL